MITGYLTKDNVDIGTLFASGTSSITTGYLTKNNVDIGTLFASGTSSITTGYLTKDNVDIGTLFSLTPSFAISITGSGTYTTTIISGYTIYTFTSGICVLNFTNANNKTVYYLCVAGGGAGGEGGGGGAGGGGAGGYLDGSFNIVSTLTTNITVGAGQAGRTTTGSTVARGSNSSISSPAITSIGGGRGAWDAGWGAPYNVAQIGGSGGGGNSAKTPGAGTEGQGFTGGPGSYAGGGGAGGTTPNNTKYGGNGKICTLNGISLLYNGKWWAGGGGGGISDTTNKNGGLGGGGGGADSNTIYQGIGGTGGINLGGNGTTIGNYHYGGGGGVNTGSGGGAGNSNTDSASGAGGSGIVVIAYLT